MSTLIWRIYVQKKFNHNFSLGIDKMRPRMSIQKRWVLENEGPSFSNASYWAENEGTSISSNLLRSQVLQEFKLQQYIALNFLQFHFMPKGQYIHFEKNWYVAF